MRLSNESESDLIRNLDIMIIDDEQPILDAMSTLFTDWSCRAQTYSSLAEARPAVLETRYRPDLIISDYRLNEQSTEVDVIAQIRELLGSDVPALLISGDTDPRLLEKIQNDEFYLLHKPVDISKLRKVVGSLCGKTDRNQP